MAVTFMNYLYLNPPSLTNLIGIAICSATQIEAFLMPIADEFRGYLEGLATQITQLRADINRKDDKDDKTIEFLRGLIQGNGINPGLEGQLRSVEASRNASARHSAMLWGAVISLSVGVTAALVPIGWEIFRYFAK